MALKGNLRDFSVTQLLNLISLAKKTGVLVVEGPADTARVVFREGKLAYAKTGAEEDNLSNILRRANKISQNQYKTILDRSANMSDKELGLLLINAGYLSQEDVLASLQNHYVSILRRLFTWVEGYFRFEPDVLPPSDKITMRIDLENVIIEGARQLREWEQLQQEIPSLEIALKFTDRPEKDLKGFNLSVEEWRVVHFVNPNNTISQIARAAKMNDLEVRRVVYSLIQAGLVELVRIGGSQAAFGGRMFSNPNKEEQKSLVNRLIQRIRSI